MYRCRLCCLSLTLFNPRQPAQLQSRRSSSFHFIPVPGMGLFIALPGHGHNRDLTGLKRRAHWSIMPPPWSKINPPADPIALDCIVTTVTLFSPQLRYPSNTYLGKSLTQSRHFQKSLVSIPLLIHRNTIRPLYRLYISIIL